jgi:hypothetical protein
MILRREGWTVIRFGEEFNTTDVAARLAGLVNPERGIKVG